MAYDWKADFLSDKNHRFSCRQEEICYRKVKSNDYWTLEFNEVGNQCSHMAQQRITFKNVLLFHYATLQMFALINIRTRIGFCFFFHYQQWGFRIIFFSVFSDSKWEFFLNYLMMFVPWGQIKSVTRKVEYRFEVLQGKLF